MASGTIIRKQWCGEVVKGSAKVPRRATKRVSVGEADMNASLHKMITANSVEDGKDKSIQSVWNHPRPNFTRICIKLRKNAVWKTGRTSVPVVEESTDDHIRRKHRGRQLVAWCCSHGAQRRKRKSRDAANCLSFEQNTKIPSKKSVKMGTNLRRGEVKDVNGRPA